MPRIAGKVALITGGARGLGLAIARRFLAEGTTVIINDVDASATQNAAAEVGGRGLEADVSDAAAVARMFEQVAVEHRRLDVLVNNAGINGLDHRPQRVEEFRRTPRAGSGNQWGGPIRAHLDFTVTETDEEWRRMLAVHLDGPSSARAPR
jgi:NAD(P)-dependent dehydrogenase (short-subunit alcohol dehydrogenase family)